MHTVCTVRNRTVDVRDVGGGDLFVLDFQRQINALNVKLVKGNRRENHETLRSADLTLSLSFHCFTVS